ncbi:DivIVA domain-containing protein [Actinophytocola algeriensis]|jgi:DivIVA domain-containing protein|uniref:Cell wall synthesis protein Wag31 n=1 Tax=Actinophytocola algeriensis TaxID=1768010 RepID=A0A7W7VIP3_9PSEU|nr:DivIVA domain-containing protein [Actinophytocola algeriensis]MBB4911668.1 DivIVA domain-containing protein [Actinophytocola algeriensis]MBE1473344.1 DivIVA domain-containing protein [Actinophytocola algeriensis]
MTELTPDDVREVVFDHAPMFHRGYDEAQVDEFLDRVETAMIALQGQIVQKQQVVDQTALRTTDPHGSSPATGREHRALADQIITDARRQADQIVENARVAAKRVVEEARAEAFRLVANASRQIVSANTGTQMAIGRDDELTAVVAEIGDRIAQIRDALSGEVSYLFEVIDQVNSTNH